MFKITLSAIIMTVLALADGSVLQTGQIKSYDADGIVVTDSTVKDDGYYQAGVTRSYSRDGDIVIDNVTGLQWQDDTSIQKAWDAAGTYCSGLPLGDYSDWRLPNIEELETIIDHGETPPSVPENIFQYISLYFYWSATTSANSASDAWWVNFDYGKAYYYAKTNTFDVRCVRGGQLESSNLSRDDTNEIVSDSATGLQWQDDSDAKTTLTGWAAAIDYCENDLTLGSYSDWRLPNKNELLSITDRSRKDPSIDVSVFQNTVLTAASYYWSSTTSASSTETAWFVRFTHGYPDYYAKNNNYYVRCVRGGEFGRLTCPEGKHLIQGERVCVPGTPASDPGEYPLIADRNYLQGDINEAGSRTEDPGWQDPYPSAIECPPGKAVAQGTGECTIDVPINIDPLPTDITIDNAALQKVIASTFDNTPYDPAIDIQGVIDAGGLTVSVPYTVVNAPVTLAAYSTSVTLKASVTQDDESGIVATFAWVEQSALAVGLYHTSG